MPEREIEVWLSRPAAKAPGADVRVGTLWAHQHQGLQSQTFAYAPEYLGDSGAFALEPALPLVAGPQQTALGHEMFGAFADSLPDRWGRRLIALAERQRARHEHDTQRSFSEVDYLLGVRDDLRQGALRFRLPHKAEFLASAGSGVPALLQLGYLLGAAERSERDIATDDDLRALLRGGSSLGGARPKTHVVDERGNLAIAKFPSPVGDRWDVIRWEAVALTLAQRAGIVVPPFHLHVIDDKPALVIQRFDRRGSERIGYVSALTMLGMRDGETGSYLEIGDALIQDSSSATDDLHELWRRVCFTVLISNYDDHLRNHGFLRNQHGGWSLAPMFDVNPVPSPGTRLLSTAIDFDSTAADIDLVMDVAPEFRLTGAEAREALREVCAAVSAWPQIARHFGIPQPEVAQMRPAFEHDASVVAASILHK